MTWRGYVDINCDMGEGAPHDAALLPLVSSANVACALHAGDPTVMRRTMLAARDQGVAIGAHPGFADRAGFGRTVARASAEEVYDLVIFQVGAMLAVSQRVEVAVSHVKPHGALYNLAADEPEIAQAIAEAVRDLDRRLLLFGLSGSALLDAAAAAGVKGVSEVFADRNYLPAGRLVPRTDAQALVDDADLAAGRALAMVRDGWVPAIDGTRVSVRADTICVHGDGPLAVPIARTLRGALEGQGFGVRPPRTA